MYQKKLKEKSQSPLEYALKLFGGKWSANIFCIIVNHEPIGYNEIKRRIEDISDPVLSSVLKRLTKHEIIERKVYNDTLRVEYSVSQKGKEAVPFLQEICKWFIRYQESEKEIQYDSYCQECPLLNNAIQKKSSKMQ